MPKATPEGIFPNGIWDGRTSTTPDVSTEKNPDIELANRYRAEIRAIEETLAGYLGLLDKILEYGPSNSVLGVVDDGTDLEYKVLTGGTGITVSHGANEITISTQADQIGFAGVSGADLLLGDAVYVSSDSKAYPAKADTPSTSVVIGFCDREAAVDEPVVILPLGNLTNPAWSLTVGDKYYLSPSVSGEITNSPPATVGFNVVPIGVAHSSTQLAIDLKVSVWL